MFPHVQDFRLWRKPQDSIENKQHRHFCSHFGSRRTEQSFTRDPSAFLEHSPQPSWFEPDSPPRTAVGRRPQECASVTAAPRRWRADRRRQQSPCEAGDPASPIGWRELPQAATSSATSSRVTVVRRRATAATAATTAAMATTRTAQGWQNTDLHAGWHLRDNSARPTARGAPLQRPCRPARAGPMGMMAARHRALCLGLAPARPSR